MRLLFLVLALLATSLSRADSLILISPEAVGRVIQPEAYDHALWIRWPRPSNPSGSNRLLSLLTGHDWRTNGGELAFDPLSNGTYINKRGAFPDLRARGVHAALARVLGTRTPVTIKSASGFVAAESLLLGTPANGANKPLNFGSPIPSGSIAVYQATDWDDAAQIVQRAGGKSVVIEYPPTDGEFVSAAWLLGDGWPQGVPVPRSTKVAGLLPAKEVGELLTRSAGYDWQSGMATDNDNAERWALRMDRAGPLVVHVMAALALLIALGAGVVIARERPALSVRVSIGALSLITPSVVLSGNLARWNGLFRLPLDMVGSILALLAIALAATFVFNQMWPQVHPLFATAVICALVLLAADPAWSAFSAVFSREPAPLPPFVLGALVASLTACIALSLTTALVPKVISAIVLIGSTLAGILLHPWWLHEKPFLAVIPILAILAGKGYLRIYLFPLFAVLPLLWEHWNGQMVWNNHGLLDQLSDTNAINTAAIVEFLLSPGVLITMLATVLFALLGGKFVRHELRRALLTKRTARALFWAAGGSAALSITQPFLLPASLVVLQAGLLVLLFDAAGPL